VAGHQSPRQSYRVNKLHVDILATTQVALPTRGAPVAQGRVILYHGVKYDDIRLMVVTSLVTWHGRLLGRKLAAFEGLAIPLWQGSAPGLHLPNASLAATSK